MALRPVTIGSRLGEHAGQTDGQLAFFDDGADSSTGLPIRHFVLLDWGVKLMHEPWDWTDEWYADIVRVERIGDDVIELTDLCVDVAIEGNGPTYRLLDLDDLAQGVSSGAFSREDAALALGSLPRFLDGCLHRGREFPPACLRPYLPPRQGPQGSRMPAEV
ncbi:MAG: hypothetical protein AB1505_16095 [Candidatus Latescibacterota bacterium]